MLYVILIAVAMLLAASWAMLPAAFLLGVITGHRKRIKLERQNAVLLEQLARVVQNSDKFPNLDNIKPISDAPIVEQTCPKCGAIQGAPADIWPIDCGDCLTRYGVRFSVQSTTGTQVENLSDWFSGNTVIDSD